MRRYFGGRTGEIQIPWASILAVTSLWVHSMAHGQPSAAELKSYKDAISGRANLTPGQIGQMDKNGDQKVDVADVVRLFYIDPAPEDVQFPPPLGGNIWIVTASFSGAGATVPLSFPFALEVPGVGGKAAGQAVCIQITGYDAGKPLMQQAITEQGQGLTGSKRPRYPLASVVPFQTLKPTGEVDKEGTSFTITENDREIVIESGKISLPTASNPLRQELSRQWKIVLDKDKLFNHFGEGAHGSIEEMTYVGHANVPTKLMGSVTLAPFSPIPQAIVGTDN